MPSAASDCSRDEDEPRLYVELCSLEKSEDGTEKIVEEFYESVPDSVREDFDFDGVGSLGLDSLLYGLVSAFNGERGGALGFFLLLLGASSLVALAENFSSHGADAIGVGALSVLCSMIFSRLYPVLTEAKDSLATLGSFFSSVTPVISSLIASSGGSGTASVQAAGMSFTLWIYGSLGGSFLLSLALLVFSSSLFSSFGGIGSFSKMISGAFTKCIGILTALLAGTLALQTFIASSADTALMRAAKYAASNLIPVVGSAVSGAMSSLAGGLSYAVSVVGGGSVAVILTVAASPVITLLLYKLCFFLVGSFMEFVGARGTAGCINAVGKGLDAVISVYSVTTVIYVFEIITFLKGGVGII